MTITYSMRLYLELDIYSETNDLLKKKSSGYIDGERARSRQVGALSKALLFSTSAIYRCFYTKLFDIRIYLFMRMMNAVCMGEITVKKFM